MTFFFTLPEEIFKLRFNRKEVGKLWKVLFGKRF